MVILMNMETIAAHGRGSQTRGEGAAAEDFEPLPTKLQLQLHEAVSQIQGEGGPVIVSREPGTVNKLKPSAPVYRILADNSKPNLCSLCI